MSESFFNTNLTEAVKVKMKHGTERQNIIAKNISKVDTPGGTPEDLAPLNFKKELATRINPVDLRTTHEAHLGASGGSEAQFKRIKLKNVYTKKPNGNSIHVDEEMLKMSENKAAFDTAAVMYRKMLGMFKKAAGDRG